MESIMLSVDVILAAIIGDSKKLDDLLDEVRAGKAYFLVSHLALYCALLSVEEKDQKNLNLLAELLKYAQIESETPDYVGGRDSWAPTVTEIQRWRTVALDESWK